MASLAGPAQPRPTTGSTRSEELVGVFMSQYMTGAETPDRDFRSLVYQAITD